MMMLTRVGAIESKCKTLFQKARVLVDLVEVLNGVRRNVVFAVIAAPVLSLLFCQARRQNSSDTSRQDAPPQGQVLLENGGFEEPGSPLPRGWLWDIKQTGNKGRVSADSEHFH